MVTTRGSAGVAFVATTVSALALTSAPAAQADPLVEVRQAVVNARAGSTCPALNYSIPLEGEAQHHAGNSQPGVPPAGQYHGAMVWFLRLGDPAANAIHGLVTDGGFTNAINDCSFKDFGVGFLRFNQLDQVSATFGRPDSAPPVNQTPALPNTTDDAELFDQPGGAGKPLGMVRKGTTVKVLERRSDNWVHISFFLSTHQLDGWVRGDVVPKT